MFTLGQALYQTVQNDEDAGSPMAQNHSVPRQCHEFSMNSGNKTHTSPEQGADWGQFHVGGILAGLWRMSWNFSGEEEDNRQYWQRKPHEHRPEGVKGQGNFQKAVRSLKQQNWTGSWRKYPSEKGEALTVMSLDSLSKAWSQQPFENLAKIWIVFPENILTHTQILHSASQCPQISGKMPSL